MKKLFAYLIALCLASTAMAAQKVEIVEGSSNIGDVGALGTVTTISATRFLSGATGAATSLLLPIGTNWFVVRIAPLAASSVTATCYAVVNTEAGNVDGGTGALVGSGTPLVWDNLNIGVTGVTIYFGSASQGGAIPLSAEYGGI
jgi:hypothetical protein